MRVRVNTGWYESYAPGFCSGPDRWNCLQIQNPPPDAMGTLEEPQGEKKDWWLIDTGLLG